MSGERVLELNYENFEDEVFGGAKPVLVEFWSEASYSCRELEGIIDDVAEEYGDQVVIGRVEADANWQTARQYNIKTVPAVLLFQNDKVVGRIDGPHTHEDYRRALNEMIAQHWVI